jgi:antirestriction protein
MTLVMEDEEIQKAAYEVFLHRFIESGSLKEWLQNKMSDQELVQRMTFLNVGCTKLAMDKIAKDLKAELDHHETHPGAAT